jgi:hypothetical protein
MSDYECYCEPGEAEGYPDVWSVSWQTARKQHRCCECHELILPGQRYERIFCVQDGDAQTFKTCEFCAKEYEQLRKKHPDVCWMKGNDDLACLLVWDLRNEDRHDHG